MEGHARIGSRRVLIGGGSTINRSPLVLAGILPIALVVVFILGLLPARFLAPWTNRIAEIAYLPLVPLGDAATATRRWLRSGPAELPSLEELEQLEVERNDYRRRLHSANERILELENLVLDLRGLPISVKAGSIRKIPANVVARSADRLDGAVRINAGNRRGVIGGAIAVHRGDASAGRVLANPGPTSSLLLPTYLEQTLIDGRLQPETNTPESGSRGTPLQLEPTDGGFHSSVDRSVNVKPGMVVRLHDLAWPDAAQGMRVAIVRSVTPRSSNPNRLDLVLQPAADPNRLARLILLMDIAPEDSTGGQP